MHSQTRNIVGASAGADGQLRLDTLQPSADEEAQVPPSHFRLLFVHAALSLPGARIVANDDIDLMTVAPGSFAALDHPLIAPHQSGQLLKISFLMAGVTASTHMLVDLSTLCDGAAYAFALVGTLDQSDTFDPTLLRVDGTPTACSLPSSVVDLGESSALSMLHAEPTAARAQFEWGATLLSLNYNSVALSFGESVTTDVATGDVFIRLRSPVAPYAPLSPIMQVSVRPQARNALLATRSHVAHHDGGGSSRTSWQVVDVGGQFSAVPASTVKLVVRNELRERRALDGLPAGSQGLSVNAIIGTRTAHHIGSAPATLGAAAATEVTLAETGGATVGFTLGSDASRSLGRSVDLADGVACAQSMQLVALIGSIDPTAPAPPPSAPAPPPASNGAPAPPPLDPFAPRAVHIDVADGYCRLVVPQVPQRVDPPAPAFSPPRTQGTLDIFGEGGPGDGGLLGDSNSAAPARRRSTAAQLGGTCALALVASWMGLRRR